MLPVATSLLLLYLQLKQSREKEEGEEGRKLSEVGGDGRMRMKTTIMAASIRPGNNEWGW